MAHLAEPLLDSNVITKEQWSFRKFQPFVHCVTHLAEQARVRPLELENVSEAIGTTKALEELSLLLPNYVDSLLWSSFRTWPGHHLLAMLWKLISSVGGCAQTLLFRAMLVACSQVYSDDAFSSSDRYWVLFGWVLASISCRIVTVVSDQQGNLLLYAVQNKMTVALQLLLCQRMQKMSVSQLDSCGKGSLVNAMATDADGCASCVQLLFFVYGVPLRAFGLVTLLALQTGAIATTISVAFIVLSVFGTAKFSSYMAFEYAEKQAQSDARIALITHIIEKIKHLKLKALEAPWLDAVKCKREMELRHIWRLVAAFAWTYELGSIARTLLPCISLTVQLLVEKSELNVVSRLTTYVILGHLYTLVLSFPNVMGTWVHSSVCASRLQKFLIAPVSEGRSGAQENDACDAVVSLSQCEFGWTHRHEVAFTLRVNLHVSLAVLIGIVGRTGAGKSSLLLALLGEMELLEGHASVKKGRVLYVPQDAFIFNGTIRENIIFGTDLDRPKYMRALSAACLEQDLAVLPGGDNTEIGDYGINLSGGQRQRVSIARAVYHTSDAVLALLDDPFSALDAEVAKVVHERALLNCMKDIPRLLVTNRVEFLPSCDQVYVVENGEITASGTYKEVALASHLMGALHNSDTSNPDCMESIGLPQNRRDGQDADHEAAASSIDGKLIDAESRQYGLFPLWVLKTCVIAFGGVVRTVLAASFTVAVVASRFFYIWWLSHWSSVRAESTDGLLVFVGIALWSSCMALASKLLWCAMTVASARWLHNEPLHSILHAPMAFFDTNPCGRILTRFSTDLQKFEMQLGVQVGAIWLLLTSMMFGMVTAVFASPFAIVGYIVTMPKLNKVRQCYICSNREVLRLLLLQRSHMMHRFMQLQMGVASVHAYQQERTFFLSVCTPTDGWLQTAICMAYLNSWMQVRLETLSALLMGVVMIACTTLGRHSLALTGLVLTLMSEFGYQIGIMCSTWAHMDVQMNSVQRLAEFWKVPSEACPVKAEGQVVVSSEWPSAGAIEFCDVWLQYRVGLPYVLRGLSLKVVAQSKVGIIGRTGAGKSSILTALLRLVQPSHGNIVIDGVDTCRLSLHDLRSKLTAIPQEPCFFNTSIRKNLDPLELYSDADVWQALESVQLAAHVQELVGGLGMTNDKHVFSPGQCQLVAFAAALLQKNKIVILDEATSSLDVMSDEIIQQIVYDKLKDTTVLIVAHRLPTVINANRIVVVDNGVVVEHGVPQELLQAEHSVLARFVAQAAMVNVRAVTARD